MSTKTHWTPSCSAKLFWEIMVNQSYMIIADGMLPFCFQVLIGPAGRWQGGNDWRSPLQWLPYVATCYHHTPAPHIPQLPQKGWTVCNRCGDAYYQGRQRAWSGLAIRRPIDYSQACQLTHLTPVATIAMSFPHWYWAAHGFWENVRTKILCFWSRQNEYIPNKTENPSKDALGRTDKRLDLD